jgi:hypothetical protein
MIKETVDSIYLMIIPVFNDFMTITWHNLKFSYIYKLQNCFIYTVYTYMPFVQVCQEGSTNNGNSSSSVYATSALQPHTTAYFPAILHSCSFKLQGRDNYSLLKFTMSPPPWSWWLPFFFIIAFQNYFHYNLIYHSTCNLGTVSPLIFVSFVYPSSTSCKVSRLLAKSSSLKPGTWR